MAKKKEEDSLDLIFHILQEHEQRLDKLEDSLDNIKKIVAIYTPKIKKLESERSRGVAKAPILQSILVVDDDRNVVNTFKMILEGNGYTVDTAYTAIDAMRKASKLHFDLVIVDMALPDTLGDILAERLTGVNENLSILMVTGYSNYKDQLEKKHDRVEVLMKPVNPEQLLAAVKETLEKKIQPHSTLSA